MVCEIKRGFVILKTPTTRPLCLLASITFYGGYKGYYLNYVDPKKINDLCIMVEYLETNISDLDSPLSVVKCT